MGSFDFESYFLNQISSKPITDLNFGSTKLRRAIINAGFKNILEVIALSEDTVDSMFEYSDANAILELQRRFQKNPYTAINTLLQKRVIDTQTDDAVIKQVIQKKGNTGYKNSPAHPTSHPIAFESSHSLPKLACTPFLKELDSRAKTEFDMLDDRFEKVMVYQAFPAFSTEFDEIDQAFQSLFDTFTTCKSHVLDLIHQFLRNAFLLYVANRARTDFHENNLWGNLFKAIGINNTNTQGKFKYLFIDCVNYRNMPLYAKEEETNCYFYTALLHGGLSFDSWGSLWQTTLLPLAKAGNQSNSFMMESTDGYSILREIKNPQSRYAPKKSVLNIIEKASDDILAPLFESALQVAFQLESYPSFSTGYTMLSSNGLPNDAMEALANEQEKTATSHGTYAHKNTSSNISSTKLIYLPRASLRLDLETGSVLICWKKHQFPLAFSNYKIDYFINGKCVLSMPIKASIGKSILGEVTIPVSPQARYNVEIKLMAPTSTEEEFVELGATEQGFTRTKPECFEFICQKDGIYRLRENREKVSKTRRVAYLVKKPYKIGPGQGMRELSELEPQDEWSDARIYLYEIDPGSSGSLINEVSGEETAVWQERYASKIHKQNILGQTSEGLDLYGFTPSKLGTNAGLPSMSIEAFDGISALFDLDIVCIADGRKISITKQNAWKDDYGDTSLAQIRLLPSQTASFSHHIEHCLIEARQKSNNNAVIFKYKFSVVPLCNFRLSEVTCNYGVFLAEYQVQTSVPCTIQNSQEDREELFPHEYYRAKTLLKDEFLRFVITSEEGRKRTEAQLALAALDVSLPQQLIELSCDHPICLADALKFGPSTGNITLASYGWRYNRAVYVALGNIPIIYKHLNHPSESSFNIFRDVSNFLQAPNLCAYDQPLKLTIRYGADQSHIEPRLLVSDIELLPCRQGYGFKTWRLITQDNGDLIVIFSDPVLCDLHIDFRRARLDHLISDIDVKLGESHFIVPDVVRRALATKREVVMTIAPTSLFGTPEYDLSTSFDFKKE